jgi:hypothetical protein
MKNNFANETLLVSGCSFTEQPYCALVPPHEVLVDKTWTHRLGFKDENIINKATGGVSNNEIIDSILNHLFIDDKNPDRIIVALTEWERFSDPFRQYNNYHLLLNKTSEEIDDYVKSLGEKFSDDITHFGDYRPTEWFTRSAAIVKELINDDYYSGEKWGLIPRFYSNLIDHTFHRIIILCEICRHRNIPLHILQLLPMFKMPPRDRDYKNFLNISSMIKNSIQSNPYSKEILQNYSEVDFIGFPWFEPMGGYHIWERAKVDGRNRFKRDAKIGYEYKAAQDFIKEKGKNPKGRIFSCDNHPNELGHQMLAERILKDMTI